MKNPDTLNEQPAEQLAEGFAQHVERWAKGLQCETGSLRTVRQAAYQASLATSTGHVCTTLDHLADTAAPPQDKAALREALLASHLVGTPQQPGSNPLILDEEGRLYLHRYFDYEQRLASRLMRAARLPAREVSASLKDRLSTLFQPLPGDTEVDWQKIAAALALRQGLTIISGGPGTGKTTTVVNLLASLIEQNADCRIALAAPTGKAAARMTEAIRQRSQHLPPVLREKLPTESFTVHRLLRFNPGTGRFVHDARNPLAIDVLIVDEASMLDLALATKLLEAVPATARIILLGDKDQLAAVESGAVFAELCADPSITPPCRADLAEACGLSAERVAPPTPARPSALHDAAVWLTRNYRFAADSAIGRLAADVNAGRAEEAVTWLRERADSSVDWQEPGAGESAAAGMAAILEGYAAYLETVRRDPADVQGITQGFDAFRVLCAVRDGPQGVEAVNDAVTRHAGKLLHDVSAAHRQEGGFQSAWYPGRPVMVLRNDYVLKLFNGDIGIALPDGSGELMVFFPDGDQGWRPIAPVRMPVHETAFATTVHKAQGSEFDQVLVLLPRHQSRVVTRELLYTAVTRAKAKVVLCGSEEVLSMAIGQQTVRRSGLLARLDFQASN